ncbi:MAG: asparagine synthetase A [Conexivisphaerales archaeon]
MKSLQKEGHLVPQPLEMLSDEGLRRKQLFATLTSHTLKYLSDQLVERGFYWLLPIVFSKSTDPLWPDPNASIEKRIEIEIYGQTVRTMQSMILHKLVASSIAYEKLFLLSPNIRIERRERSSTGKHAYEFTQLDFEIRDALSSNVIELVEELLVGLLSHLRKECKQELQELGVYENMKVPKRPFIRYDRSHLENVYGAAWEDRIASEAKEPVWVTNIPREFYDFEDFDTGRWDNYDLFVPGIGEILSGARREWEISKIERKMERDGIRKENFSIILSLAREGRLKPSAGAGIGLERLISWISGTRHIGEVQPFPKVPGYVYDL